MATLRKERILAAVNSDCREEHSRNNVSRDAKAYKNVAECFRKFSGVTETSFTENLSQEFTVVRSRLPRAPEKLHELFLVNKVQFSKSS